MQTFSQICMPTGFVFHNALCINVTAAAVVKGELNLYNMWQSDDLFHIVINENHPRGNRF